MGRHRGLCMCKDCEPVEKIETILPHFKLGMAVAEVAREHDDAPGLKLYLTRVAADGSGQAIFNFDAREFFSDLEKLVATVKDNVLIRREDAAHYAEALNLVLFELLARRPSLALRILELRNALVNNPPAEPSNCP